MKKVYLSIALFLSCAAIYCHGNTPEEGGKISRDEAVADLDFMIGYIHGTHPEMFAVYPEDSFNNKVEEIKAAFPDSLSIEEFYKRIGILAPLLGDGHTGLAAERMFNGMKNKEVFPYYGKLDPSRSSIYIMEKDWEVISINDIPSRTIVEKMTEYASGESIAFRMTRTEIYFPYYMEILYPAKEYRIKYRSKGSKEILTETVYPAVLDSANANPFSLHDSIPLYSYTIREDISTAILDFNIFDNPEKFAVLMQEMFSEIKDKKIRNLIVDLRLNGGGNSALGDELFQYISPVPFVQYGDMTMRISPNLREAFPSWEIEEPDSVYQMKITDDYLEELRENPLRYAGKGNVYTLTSANTFSSATDFAWAFQYFGMGTIVGDETGGHIVCFGDIIGKSLPHSGLRVFCSWKKFYGYGATDENTHPVRPDYPVPAEEALEYTIEKLIKGS